MREYGSQAVVWQTAINPVVALELLDEGIWKGTGVLGPEAFPPQPFLERLAELGSPHGQSGADARRAPPSSAQALGRLALRREQCTPWVTCSTRQVRGARSTGASSRPGRRGFGLAREELAEVGPRDEHQDEPRSMPPMPIHSGSVMPRIGFDFDVFGLCP